MASEQEMIAAVKAGDMNAAQALLDANPSLVNAHAESGESAVLLATYYGKRAMADLLLSRGAELTVFEAAAVGKLERVQTLTQADPTLINAFSPDGFTPVGLAAFFGHLDAVRYLLQNGAEVNVISRNTLKVMPIHSSVAGQHLEITRALLEHGAQVNVTQQDDYTPLHEAAQNGQVAMIRLLMAYGADPALRKTDGETPADTARKHNHPDAAAEIEKLSRNLTTMNHVAIAVPDLDAALAFYRDALGLRVQHIDDVPAEKVRVAFLPLGDSEIELMQPTEEGTGITRWMAKHGPGMHHVCVEVPDIRASLQRLKAHAAELINPEPVQKPDGTLYAFIHPRSAFGVLVELYQRP